jgi:predicted nucleic acid-binding protein
VLLGPHSPYLAALARLTFYRGFWSSWIVGELVRKRTEWIAERAAREHVGRSELRRRLRGSRGRVNALIDELSQALISVDYSQSPKVDLAWLRDADDWPVMQTAQAAHADTLVTENWRDFPPGEERDGVTFIRTEPFLAAIYDKFPDARSRVEEFLKAS